MENIRNFVIISHIDHGKSTLADRLLELTGTIEKRKMREQYLDMHPLEREKGITIKMAPVRMLWHPEIPNSKNTISKRLEIEKFGTWKLSDSEFILNLIDTPGHADFSYEVSRALACAEGAILLVDATQGVQAQTLSNLRMAQRAGLAIIPVINKIDSGLARIAEAEAEIGQILKIPEPDRQKEILRISAKTGEGVKELLDTVIKKVPPPHTYAENDVFRALIFDSHFDQHKGVVAYVRVFGGRLKTREKILLTATGAETEALEVGYFIPELAAQEKLEAGEIGYIATGIKEPERVKVGDTLTRNIDISKYRNVQLPGYREPQPLVYANFYPEDADDFESLKSALARLKLNDASLFYEQVAGDILGRGFRCGFLGTLHLEIISERIRREFGLEPVITTPTVLYKLRSPNGTQTELASANLFPREQKYEILEPWAKLEVIAPAEYLGKVTELMHFHRPAGSGTEVSTLSPERTLLAFEAPLAEIISGLHDELKSVTQGYGSMEYEVLDWRPGDLTVLKILAAGEVIPVFSRIVPKTDAEREGRKIVLRLKEMIPRKLFAVPLQAEAGGRIVARETLPALKKDVTGYLYGGDRTRKMKLWKKQQKGKKRLEARSKIEISPEVFWKAMK